MNLRQLRVFLVVAEIGNFTKAARELNTVQPAVSNTIKKLEEELQLSLFIRKNKSVQLTTEGEVLLKNARTIMGQLRRAKLDMIELRGMQRGEVRLGVTNNLGMHYFPEIIQKFKEQYPKLHFSVQVFGLRQMRQLIAEGQIDMGTIIYDAMPPNLDGIHFTTMEVVACASISHPFAKRKVTSYSEFVREQIIGFTKGTFQREKIEATCRKENIDPNIIFETNLIPLIKSLVYNGFGITSFLRPVVTGDPQLKIIPFEPPTYLKFAMAWKKGNSLSMANQAFIDFLLDYERK